jgi:hypothetical protein
MSVLSTLAFVVVAGVKKLISDPRDAEIAALKTQVDNLNRELGLMEIDRDDWRWRQRNWRPAGPDFRPQAGIGGLMQATPELDAQYRAQMSAQAQAQMNMQAYQAYQNVMNQNMLGEDHRWCNCVPSRSQVWAAAN